MAAIKPDRYSGRLARILAGLVLAYGIGTLSLSSQQLILLLNGLALSVASGVTTAYLPVAIQALGRTKPSRGDVLGAGIFFAGLSDVALRLESIVARDLAHPAILNTDVAAVSIFLGVMALVAFLWAPYAEDGEVPREKWGLAGLMVAIGVAIAFAAGTAQHALTPAPFFRFD
jgi:hypothetical protein